MKRIKDSTQLPRGPICAGSGLLALDLVINGSTDFEPRIWAGGSCGNVLTILSYLGWETYPIVRIGTDTAAKRILSDLKRFGVRTDFVQRESSLCTPVILQRIRTDKSGVPRHTFSLRCPVCTRWYPTHRPITVNFVEEISTNLPPIDTFYFDRISPGILRMAEKAYSSGALIVFEPSSRSMLHQIEKALSITHVLKYSAEQIKLDQSMFDKASPMLIVETLGSKGLRFKHRNMVKGQWRHLKSFHVDGLKDVAGAGDWCSAAIIDGLRPQAPVKLASLTTDQIEDLLNKAQASSAINCRFEGARGAMYSMSSDRFKRDVDRIVKKQAPESSSIIPIQAKTRRLLRSMCPNCRKK